MAVGMLAVPGVVSLLKAKRMIGSTPGPTASFLSQECLQIAALGIQRLSLACPTESGHYVTGS